MCRKRLKIRLDRDLIEKKLAEQNEERLARLHQRCPWLIVQGHPVYATRGLLPPGPCEACRRVLGSDDE